MAHRLLPFQVLSTDKQKNPPVELVSVTVPNSVGLCSCFVDEYYENIFHLYCKEKHLVQVDLSYRVGGGDEIFQREYSIFLFQDPSSAPQPGGLSP